MISSVEGQEEIEEKGVAGKGGGLRRDVEGQKMEREESREPGRNGSGTASGFY